MKPVSLEEFIESTRVKGDSDRPNLMMRAAELLGRHEQTIRSRVWAAKNKGRDGCRWVVINVGTEKRPKHRCALVDD